MKRILALFFIGVFLIGTAGCGYKWKAKFIRKRHGAVAQEQPVLVLESNEKAVYPAAVRYQEHFAYWKAWHSDLLASLGEIRKRDLRYLNGTIGELRSMADILGNTPPAGHLREIVGELTKLEEKWTSTSEAFWHPSTSARSRLEQLRREIDRAYHYSKVRTWIPEEKTAGTH